MTKTWTVSGFTGLLVLVPVTVCATIIYVNSNHEDSSRCNDRSNSNNSKTFDKCKYDDDCIENAYCQNQNVCSCKEHHVEFRKNSALRNTTKCLRVATRIGDFCEEDMQCQFTFAPQSECRMQECRCATDSHFAEGRCYKSVGLGEYCSSRHNCVVTNSFCEHDICKCRPSLHANPTNTTCITSARLGEHCDSDDECIVENSKCVQNKCDCKVKFVTSVDSQQCLKAASLIGEECQQHLQCRQLLNHTQCGPNKSCECVAGSHKRGSRCYLDVELGGYCETHHHCITRSFRDFNSISKSKVDCVDGFCTCTEGYTLTEELHDCVRFSDNDATRWQARGIFLIIFLITWFFAC